ncbi:MAG TPA: hypothetical protein VEB86_08095 [Chryseosolibacter sp.]|nr:hypothetical protein [Chryseosolibacter sp.]
MFFAKIKERRSGILLYGITPPKANAEADKVAEAAVKTLNRLRLQDIDALVVYDVQDESARTSEERPFPFSNALDPFDYACDYLKALSVPKIIYRPAGKFSKDELATWLQGVHANGFCPVFVGLPSPDFVPKTTLKEAYALWRKYETTSVIGAVTIPERHAILKDEDLRIIDKVDSGVSFFISQCIFNVEYTKQVLDDLLTACGKQSKKIPTIIFTLTICGSAKTLEFMEWLGIHLPGDIKAELMAIPNPVARSVEIAVNIAKGLIDYCKQRDIPFGFNIESVAVRKEEIDASIGLLNTVRHLLQSQGLRADLQKTLLATSQPVD